jgi:hypothetical protein
LETLLALLSPLKLLIFLEQLSQWAGDAGESFYKLSVVSG